MRITFISHRYFPQPTADSVRIASMVKSAQKRGHTVAVISNKNTESQRGETLIKTLLSPPRNTRGLLGRAIGEIGLGFNIMWKMLWHKTDVYVITSPCYITALMCWFFAICMRKKWVADIRDNYPDALIHTGMLSKNHPVCRLLFACNKWLFQRAMGVSYVVPNDLEYPRRYGITPIVVSNGFDTHKITVHKKPKDSFNILFHGSFGHMYNMKMFNAVAEKLHQKTKGHITITVMGSGINADKFNSDCIRVLPPIASDKVYKTLEKYHMGMLFLQDNPSNTTCFPVKAFEYFGQHMPVVINSKNLCAEYIKKYSTGIIADTVDTAVRHLYDLYQNKGEYESMVKNIKNSNHILSRQHQNKKLFVYLEQRK